MHIINFEFKAKTTRLQELEQLLQQKKPRFIGEDYQTDTYYNVAKGRLKLREGNIENALIYYDRTDIASPKQSDIILYKHNPDKALKDILTTVHGIKVVVAKRRKIYFIDNVKFHFDKVEGLGTFIEVEAIDNNGTCAIGDLQNQCNYYASFFEVHQNDYIQNSYSDLLLEKS
jgi:predicted adenylyl cyclase CyaB